MHKLLSFIVDIISVGLDRDFIVIGNINIRKIDNTAKKVTIPTIYVVFIILFYLIANAVKCTPSIAGSSFNISSFRLISDSNF